MLHFCKQIFFAVKMSESARARVPNFTSTEKLHLIQIISNKYPVVEDKKTDRTSSADKETAWQKIESEFNATSPVNIFSSAASLKKCYENRKKELRKTLAEEKKQLYLTGGGPPPKLRKDDTDDLLLSFINNKTVQGVDCKFDDDSDNTLIHQTLPENDIELIIEGPRIQGNDDLQLVNDWKTKTPQLEKPLREINPSIRLLNTNDNLGISEKSNVKTIPSSSRRRPTTVIKTLTSSDISKKYDLLLDKRLSLIDGQLKHQELENTLIIRKRQLEVELLEMEILSRK